MGCCQSVVNGAEQEQTRPLLEETNSLEHDHEATVYARGTNHQGGERDSQESPKWDASAQLRAIEEKLEASMVDISILDGHAFVPRNQSPVRHNTGEESPPVSRLSKISSLQIKPTKLTGPPSVSDALSKPLPTRQSVEWALSTADDLIGALNADLEEKVTPRRDLYQVLPFPPLLCDPSNK